MTVKEFIESKIQNIRDQEIVLREMENRGWDAEVDAPASGDFLSDWEDVQEDLKRMYEDGLFW